MTNRTRARCLTLGVLTVFLFFAGHRHAYGGRLKKSAPQLTGPRDMDYDHLIVAGDRIGPVKMGGLVSDAVLHLGNPDSVDRRNGEVLYYYKNECIKFVWNDSGIEPKIETGFRGITVFCDKWSTPDGLHVGSSMQEVSAYVGRYCAVTEDDRSLKVLTKKGIWYHAKNRNSPVSGIVVVPAMETWGGSCKDD